MLPTEVKVKLCKQCGELKPLEWFRRYYGGRKGTYTVCKNCEKINARAKYLRRKGDEISDVEATELDKIERLYEAQRAAGLQPPKSDQGRSKPVVDNLDDMINKYTDMAIMQTVDAGRDVPPVPADLQKWLTEQLTEEPDYYLDEIYEELKKIYRPLLCVTKDRQPVYDDTYKDVLEQILTRFYEYEESYWDKED